MIVVPQSGCCIFPLCGIFLTNIYSFSLIFQNQHFFGPTMFLDPHFFCPQYFSDLNFSYHPKWLWAIQFSDKYIVLKFFFFFHFLLSIVYLTHKLIQTIQIFEPIILLWTNYLTRQAFIGPKTTIHLAGGLNPITKRWSESQYLEGLKLFLEELLSNLLLI